MHYMLGDDMTVAQEAVTNIVPASLDNIFRRPTAKLLWDNIRSSEYKKNGDRAGTVSLDEFIKAVPLLQAVPQADTPEGFVRQTLPLSQLDLFYWYGQVREKSLLRDQIFYVWEIHNMIPVPLAAYERALKSIFDPGLYLDVLKAFPVTGINLVNTVHPSPYAFKSGIIDTTRLAHPSAAPPHYMNFDVLRLADYRPGVGSRNVTMNVAPFIQLVKDFETVLHAYFSFKANEVLDMVRTSRNAATINSAVAMANSFVQEVHTAITRKVTVYLTDRFGNELKSVELGMPEGYALKIKEAGVSYSPARYIQDVLIPRAAVRLYGALKILAATAAAVKDSAYVMTAEEAKYVNDPAYNAGFIYYGEGSDGKGKFILKDKNASTDFTTNYTGRVVESATLPGFKYLNQADQVLAQFSSVFVDPATGLRRSMYQMGKYGEQGKKPINWAALALLGAAAVVTYKANT